VITARELRRAAALLKPLDVDGDGNISLEEASPQRGMGGPGGPGGDQNAFLDRMMTQSDANGDGKLTPDEIPPQMARMLEGADANNDGEIDREELGQAMENMRNRFRGGQGGPGGQGGQGGPQGPGGFGGRAGGGDPQQMVQQMMTFDQNGDGVLTPDEVPERAMGMLRGADADGNGSLDAAELARVAERMGGRGGRGFGRGGPQGQGGPEGGPQDGPQRGPGRRGQPQPESEGEDF
jgi:Ca2+-binding EF-hand superfamily protein